MELIDVMVGDIDRATAINSDLRFPYGGADLCKHYDCALQRFKLGAVASDVEARYQRQVVCTRPSELPSLTFPVDVLEQDVAGASRGMPGPTRGHSPSVWTYTLELLATDSPLTLDASGRLPELVAAEYGKRSVWPPARIHEAFAYLLQHGLVAVNRAPDGRLVVSPAEDRLIERLRAEHALESRSPGDTNAYRALSYLRTRRLCASVPWLDRVLAEAERQAGEAAP